MFQNGYIVHVTYQGVTTATFLCRYPGTGSWVPFVDSPLALFLKVRETILHLRLKKKLAKWYIELLKKQHLFHNLPNFYNPALEGSFYNVIWLLASTCLFPVYLNSNNLVSL